MIRLATQQDVRQFVARAEQGEFEHDPITPTNYLHMFDFLTIGISKMNGVVFVYIDGEEVKGIIGGFLSPYIFNFDILHAHEAIRMCKKGEGIAKKLIEAFETWASWKGATQVVVTEYYSYTEKRLDSWMKRIGYEAVQQTYFKEVK